MSESTNPYQRPNSENETQQPLQWKSVVVSSVVSIAIIMVVGALILPSVRVARGPARGMQCKNNLKNIALALHNYAASNGGNFPPAFTVDANGKRLHSWRTLILAHIDRRDLYARVDFSKPWDDPSNAGFQCKCPCLCVPVERKSAEHDHLPGDRLTRKLLSRCRIEKPVRDL